MAGNLNGFLKTYLCFAILPFALAYGADKEAGPRSQAKEAKPVAEYKTPFGVSRSDGKAVKAPEKTQPPADLKVIEAGDSLRFEQPSPFGLRKWARKKSELTEMEKAAWELSKAGKGPVSEKSSVSEKSKE